MRNIDRRTFLQLNLGLAVGLIGCASQGSSFGSGAAAPSNANTARSLFAGEIDPPDLTKPGEMPPSEIPSPGRFFGPDVAFPGPLPAVSGSARILGETFEHVVVLQMENRAFDHIMGYLYPSNPNFNGVANKNLSNPIPAYAPGSQAGSVAVARATTLQSPILDPAEQYTAVNLALYNQFNPPSNQNAKEEADFVAPYNLPDGGAYSPAPMNGFVTSFYWRLLSMGKSADYASYSTIMDCFPPSLVPVISQLAQGFAVCDNWYCGVPSQTYCNRSFFHAASSSGYLVNSPATNWILRNTAPTIFDSLTHASRTWTVYYDVLDAVVATRFINYPTMKKYSRFSDHFKDMSKFYDDVEQGKLPDYSFVQPRFVLDTNSYHPDKGAPAIKRGEILLNDVYQAIRQSNSVTGSNYLNTLLIVTFDEGGTCYDHVQPPVAVPPGDTDPAKNEYGFRFDRHGQRIPTILVSPWLAPGTIINTQLDATSVMKTLEEKFSMPPINQRDQASNSLLNIPVLATPRDRSQLPRLLVRKLVGEEALSDANAPMGEMAEGLVRLAHSLVSGKDEDPPGVVTVQDAQNFLASLSGL